MNYKRTGNFGVDPRGGGAWFAKNATSCPKKALLGDERKAPVVPPPVDERESATLPRSVTTEQLLLAIDSATAEAAIRQGLRWLVKHHRPDGWE